MVACLAVSFALPFLEVPQEWSFREGAKKEAILGDFYFPINAPKASSELIDKELGTKESIPLQLSETSPAVLTPQITKLSVQGVLKYIYLIVFGIFALNFLIQLGILIFQIVKNPRIKDGAFHIVEVDKDTAPFSFLNFIFINPTKYDWDTYNQILEHEKIHSSQGHSLDILMAELVIIFQWFNPFAWKYRKEIENNLEYLTDQKMLIKGANPQAYQMNLLKVAVPNLPLNLTTNYNQSTLKKRILMMNAKKSSAQSSWKYFFILPILGLSVICLNTVKVNAQHLDSNTEIEINEPIEQTEITEPIELTEFESISEYEQAEEVEWEEGMESAEEEASPEDYMQIMGFENAEYFADEYKGNWSAEIEKNQLCIQFIKIYDAAQQHIWAKHDCYPLANFGKLPVNENGEFQYSGEAGTIVFSGKFKGDENGDVGEGTYEFTENPEFRNYLEDQGFSNISEETLFSCLLSKIDKQYFQYLKNKGFEKISDKELNALANHGLSEKQIDYYISGFQKVGINELKIKDLIQMEIHDVNVEYVAELKDYLNKDLTISDVVKASIHNIDSDYIKEFKAAGYDDLNFDGLVKFAIHDVDVAYIKELKSSLGDLKEDEIIKAAIHDIDADYIKEFRAAGFDDLDFDDLVKFAIHDIDIDYIKELKTAGFDDLSNDEIVGMAIHDVDADYVKSFKEAGLNGMGFDEMIGFAIHDIDMDYVKELKAAGFTNLSNEEIIGMAIHNIDGDYVKSFRAAGFDDMDFEDIIGFAIHDVDIDFIKELKSAGFEDLSKDEIIGFAIHDIDVDFIKEYQELGYDNLDKDDLIKLGIHDIDAGFIKDLESVGFNNLDVEDLVKAGIHDVDGDFIKKMRAKGKNYDNIEDYIRLKMHNGHGRDSYREE